MNEDRGDAMDYGADDLPEDLPSRFHITDRFDWLRQVQMPGVITVRQMTPEALAEHVLGGQFAILIGDDVLAGEVMRKLRLRESQRLDRAAIETGDSVIVVDLAEGTGYRPVRQWLLAQIAV